MDKVESIDGMDSIDIFRRWLSIDSICSMDKMTKYWKHMKTADI